jgi:hypothetical protein
VAISEVREPFVARDGPALTKEQVSGMTKNLLTVLGALSLVACGGTGVPWNGDGEPGGGPEVGTAGGPSAGTGYGGSSVGEGGYESGGYATGGSYIEGGGYSSGGTGYGGSYVGEGGYEHGGTGIAGGGGYASGGTGSNVGGEYGGSGSGGYASGGTGSQGGDSCSQNVAQCFEAAANCYQFSPWSDCDQIVDVCQGMQLECAED